jgi:type II secretory pathway component GspD/PulD (secretin)
MAEKLATFTTMTQGTADDYQIIAKANIQHGINLPDRILEHLELLKGDLTFSAVFDYLSTYGKTTTNQSVMLKGLNGLPLSIRSGKSIPFIKDVSSNTTTGGSTSDTSKSAKVETIETGIELEMNPYYDVENQITSVSVKLDLVTLLGFIELEAGNDTTLSQPSTQDQSFESYVKLRLGESTVMGGVTFESVGDKRNSLSFIDNLNIAHRNEGIEKNAIFILIRPTITVYGDFEKDIEIIK